MIQGYSSEEAIDGAKKFCARNNRQSSIQKVETDPVSLRATALFACP